MFFETRKLMDSSNFGYLHDLPAKFQDDLKNCPHTTIILDYTIQTLQSQHYFVITKPNIT